MAAPAELAFVAGPSTTPTVVYSLRQPGLVSVLAESFSLGGLDFQGDPETGTGSYGTRQVEFTLQFTGTYEEAATAIQSVVRQLTQPAAGFDRRNWLMFRWTGGQPFFLAMYPASVGAVDWRESGAGVWEMPVSLTCEFGIWGAPVDIASFTITNDPTTGTNRMMVGPSTVTELGAVKGDLETPLMLAQTTGPGVSLSVTQPVYVASYSLTGNTHAFLARDLTELTSGTDTGATVSGAGANYIGGNYKSCSFATASMATRLSGTFSTALTPMPGRYRMLLRIVIPNTAGTNRSVYTFRVSAAATGLSIYGDIVSADITGATGADLGYLVDLGIVQFPSGNIDGPVGLGPAATTVVAPRFDIQAAASLVTGSLLAVRFDELYLLPVDTAYGTARMSLRTGTVTSGSVLVYDAVNGQARSVVDTGSGPFSGQPSTGVLSWVGGLPTVMPGVNNYLQLLYENTVVTNTAAMTGRYYPRYAHVKPATT